MYNEYGEKGVKTSWKDFTKRFLITIIQDGYEKINAELLSKF